MSAPRPLADCCPRCDVYADACAPLAVIEEPGHEGSLCAFYRCPDGHEWQCWWDARSAGWPAPGPRRDAAA